MATTLTDRQIQAAQTPDDLNQTELRDDKVRGLLLRVYSSGTKTWFLFYRCREDNRRRYYEMDDGQLKNQVLFSWGRSGRLIRSQD